MQSVRSIASLVWALLLVLVAFIGMGSSFKQELWFYDVEGNAHVFFTNATDTADLALFLPKVTSYCTRGTWGVYSEANFLTYHSLLTSNVLDGSLLCNSFTSAAAVNSLRHLGASDTDTDALSLYEDANFSGKEVFVTARAHLGIINQIESIAITGDSTWTLFEGQELDGKSKCYLAPQPFKFLGFDHVRDLGLTTIGSVIKGCDAQDIQNYKMLQGFQTQN